MSTKTNANRTKMIGLAVTTALATTILSGCTAEVAPTHAYSAAKAETALAKGQGGKAVDHAEAAVLASPRDAETRILLGNAYLEAGRFVSASTAFADAVTLGDAAPRTVVSYALTQIATGDQAGAIETLRAHQSTLDPADYGLAIALAGRPQEGVHVLNNALRAGNNTPKVRQNLAYAFALQGNWRAARLMAAEDVPADQVGTRMAEWASLARPELFQLRVAKLLNVEFAPDQGQPAMLALSNHPSVPQMAAEVSEPVPSDEAPATAFAFAGELPPAAGMQSLPADTGEAAVADAALARVAERPARVAVAAPATPAPAFTPRPVIQDVPAKPAARVAAAPAPSRAPAPRRIVADGGDYNVQLGSYFSMSDANAAWRLFQSRYPQLAGAEKSITKARVNGKIYYRVAAAGFAKTSARAMCSTVKASGHGCIAYASSNPLPGAIASDIRVAAR